MNDGADLHDLVRSIDWNQAWQAARARTGSRWDGRTFWNGRAPSLAEHARETDFSGQALDLLQPAPEWTVLDVGCGAGTLAVPLAARVKSVTAMDISDAMLGLLGQRCAEERVGNVRPVLAGWEDDWSAAGVGVHDVVLASRSLFAGDLAAAIDKLQDFSRRRVVIVSLVGDGPYDRQVYEAVGRPLYRGPDFVYIINYLAQAGIFANLSFITEVEDKSFANLDEAVAGTRWMVNEMTAEEESRLRAHLAGGVVGGGDGVAMPRPKVTRWAAIWWERS